MEIEYTEAEQAFRQELRGWLAENVPDEWDRRNQSTLEDPGEHERLLRDWERTLHEGGWAGLDWPEEYGGQDATLMEQVIFEQEMARARAPPHINFIGLGWVGPTIIQEGTEAQKERFLEPILTGEEVWCQGFSEPAHGSDLAAIELEAERRGDEYLLNGQKIWSTHAQLADWCFVLARTEETDSKFEGITAFLVDMDQEGITTEPIRQITDDHGFNQTFFDDAVARPEHVVGEEGAGWETAMTLVAFEHSSSGTWGLEVRLDELIEFCQTHRRDGRLLSDIPRVRRKLAEFDTRIRAAQLTHLRNVSKHAETGVPGPEGSMDMVASNDIAHDMESFALELLGPGAGLWDDGYDGGGWAHRYLFTYGSWIGGGTGDIQRNIIGERVLGLPKDPKSDQSHK
jgi:alkylation response protein AidB-like acyl-CoA dehydrogenase